MMIHGGNYFLFSRYSKLHIVISFQEVMKKSAEVSVRRLWKKYMPTIRNLERELKFI